MTGLHLFCSIYVDISVAGWLGPGQRYICIQLLSLSVKRNIFCKIQFVTGSLCFSPAPEPTVDSGRRTPSAHPAWDGSVRTRPTTSPAAWTSTVSTTFTTSQVKEAPDKLKWWTVTEHRGAIYSGCVSNDWLCSVKLWKTDCVRCFLGCFLTVLCVFLDGAASFLGGGVSGFSVSQLKPNHWYENSALEMET